MTREMSCNFCPLDYIQPMNQISLFQFEESQEEADRLDALAEAEIAAGNVISQEDMVAWLKARARGEKVEVPAPRA
jgi:hypothetical protein